MAETVTLELSPEVSQRAKEVANRTGQQVEAVLTAWLEIGAANEAAALFLPGVEYPIYTPYGNEAAAQVLLDALQQAEAADRKQDRRPE